MNKIEFNMQVNYYFIQEVENSFGAKSILLIKIFILLLLNIFR